jgi:uncharacterized protein DUF3558
MGPRRWRRTGRSVALLATGWALAACGGGDDDDDEAAGTSGSAPGFVTFVTGDVTSPPGGAPGTSGEAVDPCTIVSREEAAETLGMAVHDGEFTVANFDQGTCRWPSESDFGEISVEVRNGDPARFTEFYESDQGEPVEGVGDRAQWFPVQGLQVLTDEYFVGVFTINVSEEETVMRDRSIALAQNLLDRLP